jgi:hypothetical protein
LGPARRKDGGGYHHWVGSLTAYLPDSPNSYWFRDYSPEGVYNGNCHGNRFNSLNGQFFAIDDVNNKKNNDHNSIVVCALTADGITLYSDVAISPRRKIYKVLMGNVIDTGLTLEAASMKIEEYEAMDKKEGVYTPNFYEIKAEE